MENLIKIYGGNLYLFASPTFEQAAIVYFSEKDEHHLSFGVVSYKNLSMQYLEHLMEQKNLTNFMPINLDETSNNECFFIAEDLEEKRDILTIYKNKKNLVIDNPFEEAPPIPEGFNI